MPRHAVPRPPLTAAVLAALALAAVPAQGATRVSTADKSQNTAIKKAQKSATSAGKTAKSASKNAKKALKDAATGIANAKTADGKAVAAQNGLNVLLGQVPPVLDRLSQLSSGLSAAGAGLTRLESAAAAVEHGIVKVQLAGADVPEAILTSPDIPDDGNAAIASGSVLMMVPADIFTPAPVTLLAGVRSGEADGTGAADPVASAGLVSMTVTPVTSGLTVAGGNTGLPAEVPLTSKGNPAAGSAPTWPIPLKAPLAAPENPFSFPTDRSVDLTDVSRLRDLSGAGATPFTIVNGTVTRGYAMVTFTVRFNDLTVSTADPAA